MTTSLADARDKAKRVFNRNRTAANSYVYKSLRNQSNTLANLLKKTYIDEAIRENKDNVGTLSKTIRLLVPSKKDVSTRSIEISGATEPLEIANDFNSISVKLVKLWQKRSLILIPRICLT